MKATTMFYWLMMLIFIQSICMVGMGLALSSLRDVIEDLESK